MEGGRVWELELCKQREGERENQRFELERGKQDGDQVCTGLVYLYHYDFKILYVEYVEYSAIQGQNEVQLENLWQKYSQSIKHRGHKNKGKQQKAKY